MRKPYFRKHLEHFANVAKILQKMYSSHVLWIQAKVVICSPTVFTVSFFQNYLLLYLLYWFTILILIHFSWISVACVCSCEWGKLWLLVTLLKILVNCFCGMVDRRMAFSLISSRDHCQKFSPSRISDTPRTGFELAQNLNSGFVEWSCAVVTTTTPRRQCFPDIHSALTLALF